MTPLRNPSPDSPPERTTMPPDAGQDPPVRPEENQTHGMERQPSLGERISARTNRPHKGDVGRPGTNEEVYQGSKQKELK